MKPPRNTGTSEGFRYRRNTSASALPGLAAIKGQLDSGAWPPVRFPGIEIMSNDYWRRALNDGSVFI